MRSKSDKRGRRSTPHGKVVKAVIGKSVSNGREIWHVASDGARRTLVTSDTSVRAMDQAVKIFGPALRRLAYR